MENYSYSSYPESGDSSPRSRETEFDNPPPWEEPTYNYKVKFMCSYGGKIQPRPHDNHLSYLGGQTKILTVDRNIKFSALVSKLSSLCDADVCFKYQMPGEDLDALISVTNEDDLDHMMHEYDRLSRASAKPARLRLFFFTLNPPSNQSSASTEGKFDRDQFVDALNSGPAPAPTPSPSPSLQRNVDLLFGSEKGMPPPVPTKVRDPITDSSLQEPDIPVPGVDDRVMGLDPIQKHIQDLQRIRIGEEQAMYRRKSDENLVAAFSGDLYVQKMPEKVSPTTLPGTVQIPAGYWQEKQITGVFPATTRGTDQPVYMIPSPAGVYHAPMAIPMTGPTGQGYYTVPRMPTEVYRDQPVYNVVPQAQSAAAPPTLPPQPPSKAAAAYSEGFGMVLPGTTGVVVADTGYAQMAYDSAVGRQLYYTTPGGAVTQQPPPPQTQYQAMAAAAAYSADMRPAGTFNQEGGKVVPETST